MTEEKRRDLMIYKLKTESIITYVDLSVQGTPAPIFRTQTILEPDVFCWACALSAIGRSRRTSRLLVSRKWHLYEQEYNDIVTWKQQLEWMKTNRNKRSWRHRDAISWQWWGRGTRKKCRFRTVTRIKIRGKNGREGVADTMNNVQIAGMNNGL